jgi:gliding motility associated protien GldN
MYTQLVREVGKLNFRKMKNFVVVASVFFTVGVSNAQFEEINGGPVNVQEGGVVDGVYIQEHIPTKRLIPYEYVREADVIWSKRVWSYIDLREKVNHPLYYPLDKYQDSVWVKNATRWSLWTVIKHHILSGDLTLFEPRNPADFFEVMPPDGDQFKYPLRPQPGLNYYTDKTYHDAVESYLNVLGEKTFEPVASLLTGEDSVIVDPFTGVETTVTQEVQKKARILSEHIVQYRLKEDWFFDKERSLLDVRILGIAPVIYKGGVVEDVKNNPGPIESSAGYQILFWLYFPHCRFVFNNYFVYNDANDAQWMSFDDLFWKRRFASVMYKESNVYERKIETYKTGVDALMESEKIKEEIRTIEHDVWSF